MGQSLSFIRSRFHNPRAIIYTISNRVSPKRFDENMNFFARRCGRNFKFKDTDRVPKLVQKECEVRG
jgi:hypothetical protein